MAPRKRKKVDLGPSVFCKFLNLENPGNEKEKSPELRFNYEGRKFGPFVSNFEYEMPQKVMDHLNELSIPIYEMVNDPKTNTPYNEIVGFRNRFMAYPASAPAKAKTEAK